MLVKPVTDDVVVYPNLQYGLTVWANVTGKIDNRDGIGIGNVTYKYYACFPCPYTASVLLPSG